MALQDLGFWAGTAVSTVLSVFGIRSDEQPRHEVVMQQERMEIRRYPPLLVAEATAQGSREETSDDSFRVLAGFIFGKNVARQPIAMTAPVVTEPRPELVSMTSPVVMEPAGDAWVMRFVLPSKYTMQTVPLPNDARVKLREMPGEELAVIRFSGTARADEVARREAMLQAWLPSAGYEPAGPGRLAQYDPPFALPFLRRNEVMIPVRKAAQAPGR